MLRAVLTLVLFLAAYSCSAHAEKRVALIVGNGAYEKVGRLANPGLDAGTIAEMFRTADFDIVELKRDLGAMTMRRTLREFSDEAREADIAVVLFAGHGIEVTGANYLVPVNAVLKRDIDVEDEAVPLERVIQILEPAKRLRRVVLVAYRDNPIVPSMRRTGRAIGRGLVKVDDVSSDTLIAFAAKAAKDAYGDSGMA